VIVPTKDRPHWLAEALASVRRVADRLQGRAALECLVIDDGDDPATPGIVRDAGARYLRSYGHGVSAARNTGLRAATGEFIAFLDDDDVWTEQHVGVQLDALDADPSLGAAFGQIIVSDTDLQPRGEAWPQEPLPDGDAIPFFGANIVQLGAFLVRQSAAQRAGGFDERLAASEDWDWQLRLARATRVAGIPVPVVSIRQHRDPRRQDLDEWWRRRLSDEVVVQRVRRQHLRGRLSPLAWLRWSLRAVPPLGYDTSVALAAALSCLEHRQEDRGMVWLAGAWHISPVYAARLTLRDPRLWLPTVRAMLQGQLAANRRRAPARVAQAEAAPAP
jgi:glycosyltransferase involved in cell wall biosynthesis